MLSSTHSLTATVSYSTTIHTASFLDRFSFLSSSLFSTSYDCKRCRFSSTRRFRIRSHFSKTEEISKRKCSPFLESSLLSSNGAPKEWQVVPDIWRTSAEKYGDKVAVVDPYHDPPTNMTYKQLKQEILDFSEGLRVIGLKPGEKIALFSENSCRWLVADQGMMAMGAINVVRGSRSSSDELVQIYNHSESVALAVDSPELFNRIAETFHDRASLRFVILLWGDKSCLAVNGMEMVPVFNYREILELGLESRRGLFASDDAGKMIGSAIKFEYLVAANFIAGKHYTFETISSDDIATLVYTSGTTGNPKGVMLTHKNLLHQINNLSDIVPAKSGDRFLSMLPPWHAYERASEYFIFSRGGEHVYTTVKNLKDDLQRYQPHYMVSVPLVYETLYRGIQKQISASSALRKLVALTLIRVSLVYMDMKRIYEGMCLTRDQKQPSYFVSVLEHLWARIFAAILLPLHMLAKKLVYRKIRSAIGISKACISGGGSLPMHVDKFFEAIELKLQNGYGMTELSPVTAARRPHFNVVGSVGHPIRRTEIRIVDAETGETLPPGSEGIVKVRGPHVMKGYYKNTVATEQTLDQEGWLNTGDIGWIAPHHSTGRSRWCGGIVVLEGRAKDTIVLSTGENVEPTELEEAAMRSSLIQQIVVIGQDKRRPGAIIVPNKEEVLMAAKELSIVDTDASELSKQQMSNLINEELRKWTSRCSYQIGPILIVDKPLTIDSGLMTPTMKIRRDKVVDKYRKEIDNLYN